MVEAALLNLKNWALEEENLRGHQVEHGCEAFVVGIRGGTGENLDSRSEYQCLGIQAPWRWAIPLNSSVMWANASCLPFKPLELVFFSLEGPLYIFITDNPGD